MAAAFRVLLFTSAISIVLPLVAAQAFGSPSANLSTLWAINPSASPNVTYSDGSIVFPLLVRGSLGPSFTFGFSCSAPCNVFLLSIFIVYTNRLSEITLDFPDPPQIVWSANRDRLVSRNATVLFSLDGDLILRDANGSLVWSTNTSGRGAKTLTLSGSGNLLILDPERRNIWASFDHPTDSLLLGQSLKEGQRLTAKSSATNVTSGQLYLAVVDGLEAFVDASPPQLYFTDTIGGFSNAQNRSAFVTFNNGSLDMFVTFTQPEVPDTFISLPASSSYQYMRLEDDGHLRLYGWSNGWKILKDVFDLFPDDCAYPTVCGPYGICLNGQCSCPQAANGDSSFFKPVNPLQINLGCRASSPISCKDVESHQFLALNNVSYFNFIDQSASVLDNTNAERCKQACMRNCSCKAALFQYGKDPSFGACFLPSQIFSLMFNRPEITHYNSVAFIKVQTPISEPPPSVNAFPEATSGSRSWRRKLVVGLVVGFILAVLLLVFIIVCVRRKIRGEKEEDQFDEVPGMVRRFSYEELKSATKNFEEKLGQGGFGSVFKGTLSNGVDIAVKRLDDAGQAKEQFLAEIETIGSVHHINLVSLIGFCVQKSHKLLVLEYIPNGSLDTWIFGEKATSLDWKTRRNIIFNIAKGLAYLHEECLQKIAHLDIKPQNILLDQNFIAKVGDFGLAKLIDRNQNEIMTRMRGTPGYLAPEWLTSIVTEKVDVYSFGVVVAEIICGRKNLYPSQNNEAGYLIAIIQEKMRDDLLADLFDKNCTDIVAHKEEALETMRLAIWCLQIDSSRRPSMSMVVKVLEGSSDVQFDIDSDLLGTTPFI